jgi:hypothetical protein
MSWCIGRERALSDPIAAKLEIMQKLRALELEDSEGVITPVLVNAVLLVESHRAARHQIPFLDDLSRTVDAMIRVAIEAERDAVNTSAGGFSLT